MGARCELPFNAPFPLHTQHIMRIGNNKNSITRCAVAEIKGRQPDLALVYFTSDVCVCAWASAPSRAALYIEAIKFADTPGQKANKKRSPSLKKPDGARHLPWACVKFALGDCSWLFLPIPDDIKILIHPGPGANTSFLGFSIYHRPMTNYPIGSSCLVFLHNTNDSSNKILIRKEKE